MTSQSCEVLASPEDPDKVSYNNRMSPKVLVVMKKCGSLFTTTSISYNHIQKYITPNHVVHFSVKYTDAEGLSPVSCEQLVNAI